MRAEMAQAKRENAEYLQRVEKARMQQAISERKRKQAAREEKQARKQLKAERQERLAGGMK